MNEQSDAITAGRPGGQTGVRRRGSWNGVASGRRTTNRNRTGPDAAYGDLGLCVVPAANPGAAVAASR